MATLVLTVLGGAIGGPVGAIIGASIGQRVDQRLFGPKGRQGPRLGDLAVQTSSYGSALPHVFGAVRLSGTVIWATDLQETRRKVSAGKGQPKSTVYSYAAHFAVALSARPIRRVGRIWADGKLLRGAAGDFKTQTGFRLHPGSPDQSADPLIASAEGAEQTPAYRGLAYAVFEDFQLEAFGNRIPSLSFEVFGDEEPVSAGTIVMQSAGAGVTASLPALFDGMAVTGGTVADVAAALFDLLPFSVQTTAEGLHFTAGETPLDPPAVRDLGARADGNPSPGRAVERKATQAVPDRIALRYLDPARDYQPGLQRVMRAGPGGGEARIEMAATLSAGRARTLADRLLAHRSAGRTSMHLTLPWRALPLSPGDVIPVPGEAGLWRIAAVSLEAMVVRLSLVRLPMEAMPATPGSPGRPGAQTDVPHGPTRLAVLDLPPITDTLEASPVIVVAASGPSPGWRRAALLTSLDQGASWQEAGQTAAPALIGTVTLPPPRGAHGLVDHASSLNVTMANAEMILTDADAVALNAGANAAMLGDELIQFGSAQAMTPGVWRLSALHRGLRGTEWAQALHQPGESFVLLDEDSLVRLSLPGLAAGLRVMAIGLDDGETPPVVTLHSAGAALMPLSPVHLTQQRLPSGDVQVRWIRRSRAGWRWDDQVDAPLGEEREAYRVTLDAAPLPLRELETSSPVFLYDGATQAADRAAGAEQAIVSIRQIGTHGLSRAAVLSIPL